MRTRLRCMKKTYSKLLKTREDTRIKNHKSYSVLITTQNALGSHLYAKTQTFHKLILFLGLDNRKSF